MPLAFASERTQRFVLRSVHVLVAIVFMLQPLSVFAAPQNSQPATLNANAPRLEGTATPVATGAVTPVTEETLVPEPTVETTQVPTPTITVEPTLTPTVAATPEPTETPTVTVEATLTPTISGLGGGVEWVLLAEPTSVQAGDLLTFTAIITNWTANPLAGARFVDDMPNGLAFVPAGSEAVTVDRRNNVVWAALPSLAVGASAKVTYVFRVQGPGQYAETLATNAAQIVLADGTAHAASVDYIYAPPGHSVSAVLTNGGVARGLAGRVAVHVPPQAFGAGQHVVLFNRGQEVPGAGYTLSLEVRQVMGANQDGQGRAVDAQRELVATTAMPFTTPVTLEFDLSGVVDFHNLPPQATAYVATFDEASQSWVRLPDVAVDPANNRVLVASDHFSLWGAGVFSNTQATLVDNALPDLSTGAMRLSYPLWTPPGPGGLQPDLALNYSSSKVDGILQDVQASWIGLGWDLSGIAVLREITIGRCEPCGEDVYGYRQEYTLLFNGAGHRLLPIAGTTGEYNTETTSSLRVVRHNPNLGNAGAVNNSTDEWWEVFDGKGNVYRLGYNPDAEQIVTMHGYSPSNATDPGSRWSVLGYAGTGTNVVANKWLVDRVTNATGQALTYIYSETLRTVYNGSITYDQATYPSKVSYGPYTVTFGLQSRGSYDGGPTGNDLREWSQWDDKQLMTVTTDYQGTPLRQYVLNYLTSGDPDTHQTLRLAGITEQGFSVTGTVVSRPPINFTYTFFGNRLCDGGASPCPGPDGWKTWVYPRLTSINNGYGASVVYTYTHDNRASGESGSLALSYRVTNMTVSDAQGLTPPQQTVFTYDKPAYTGSYQQEFHGCDIRDSDNPGDCYSLSIPGTYYSNPGIDWCWLSASQLGEPQNKRQCQREIVANAVYYVYNYNPLGYNANQTYWSYAAKEHWGSLLGYEVVTVTRLNTSGNAELIQTHYFHTRTVLPAIANTSSYVPPHPYNPLAGREYRTETRDGAGNLLTSQDTNYGVLEISSNPSRWLTYVDSTYSRQNGYAGKPGQSHRTTLTHDNYGQVTSQIDYGWEEYVLNAGFENGLTGWNTFGTAPVASITATTPVAGRRVVSLQGTGTGGVYQDFTGLIPGLTYTVRTWVKAAPGSTVPFSLWVHDTFGGNAQSKDISVYTSTIWTEVIVDYLAPVTGTLRVHLNYTTANGGTLYVDEVSVARQGSATDGRTVINETLALTDSRWLIGLPWRSRTYAGIVPSDYTGTPVVEQLTAYDGATDPLNQTGVITRGLPTFSGQGLWGTAEFVSTTTQYDGWGNATVVTNPLGVALTTTYDALLHLYPVQTQNAKNHIVTTAYDYRFGLPTVVTDANGNVTTYVYDAFGRPYEQYRPGDAANDPTVRWMYMDTWTTPAQLAPFNIRSVQKPGTSSMSYGQRHFYDGLGREIQTHSARSVTVEGAAGLMDIVVSVGYNALGQVISQTVPYSVPATNGVGNVYTTTNLATTPATLTRYDALGRTSVVTAPDGTSASTIYGEDTTIALDPAGQPRLTVVDGLNRTVAVNETYAVWRDTFSDTTLTNTQWISITGNATESGGQALLTGAAYLTTTLGGDKTGGLISFYYDGVQGNKIYIALRTGTYQTAGYRRWGAYIADGVLYRNSTEGPDVVGQNLPLLTLKPNTWYQVLLRSGAGGQSFIVAVWEKNTPSNSAVWREMRASWPTTYTWAFLAQNLPTTTTLKVDDFTRLDYYQTNFSYNPLNQITQVKDTLGNTTVLTYNVLNQKTGMLDPDMGNWNYVYDAAGNLKQQTDARGCVVNFGYDVLNRITSKTYNTANCAGIGASTSITYAYDFGLNGKGQRTGMGDASGLTAWQYNARGLLVTETRQLNTSAGYRAFSTYFGYDLLDRPLTTTYPTNEVVTQTYNNLGLLENMRSSTYSQWYATNMDYDASGRLTTLRLGAGVLTTTYTFYGWTQQGGRLKQIRTTNSGSTDLLQNLNYNYDVVGNITTITDGANSNQVQTFGYDSLNRLTSASTNAVGDGQYNETYGYNAIGNFITKTTGVTVTYNYTDTAHKHAVTTLSNGNLYQYDAAGNMTYRKEANITYQQSWNADNLLAVVTNTTTNQVSKFTYDGDGKRMKMEELNGSTLLTTTLYVGTIEVKLTASTQVTNTYYGKFAMRIDSNGGTTGPYFLHADHLGSTTLITNLSGFMYSKQLYHPYGTVRYAYSVAMLTAHTYTGQTADVGTGLMYYQARYYSPLLGRFIAADTMIPNASSGQSYNRYAYVGNNPINRVDPTGHVDCSALSGSDAEDCEKQKNAPAKSFWELYGITLVGNWTEQDKLTMRLEVLKIAAKFAQFIEGDQAEIFRSVFGRLTFTLNADGVSGVGCAAGGGFVCSQGTGGRLSRDGQRGLVIHELGHVFDHAIDGWGTGRKALQNATITDEDGNYVTGYNRELKRFIRTEAGYQCATFPCEQHPITLDNQGPTAGEDFADMFMNWVNNSFSDDAAGRARYQWMEDHMEDWLRTAMEH